MNCFFQCQNNILWFLSTVCARVNMSYQIILLWLYKPLLLDAFFPLVCAREMPAPNTTQIMKKAKLDYFLIRRRRDSSSGILRTLLWCTMSSLWCPLFKHASISWTYMIYHTIYTQGQLYFSGRRSLENCQLW